MIEKTTKRPDLRKMKINDVLHVGTEDAGEIFTVKKIGENSFIFDQGGVIREYGRSVMAKNIYTFAEKFKGVYWITHDDDEE